MGVVCHESKYLKQRLLLLAIHTHLSPIHIYHLRLAYNPSNNEARGKKETVPHLTAGSFFNMIYLINARMQMR